MKRKRIDGRLRRLLRNIASDKPDDLLKLLIHPSAEEDPPTSLARAMFATDGALPKLVELLDGTEFGLGSGRTRYAAEIVRNLALVPDMKSALIAAGAKTKLMGLVEAGIGAPIDSERDRCACHSAEALGNLIHDRDDPAAAAAMFSVEDVESLIELLDLVRSDASSPTAEAAAKALVNLLNSGNSLVEYNIMDSFDSTKHGPRWDPPSLSDLQTYAPLRPLLEAMQVKANDFVDEGERFRSLFAVPSTVSQERQRLRNAMTALDEFSDQMPEEAYRRIANALAGRGLRLGDV